MQGVLQVENFRVISVVYRFFRSGFYFQARDNRLTVTSSSRSNFFKIFYFGQAVMQWVLISVKLPSNICCLKFVSSRILFSRERQ